MSWEFKSPHPHQDSWVTLIHEGLFYCFELLVQSVDGWQCQKDIFSLCDTQWSRLMEPVTFACPGSLDRLSPFLICQKTRWMRDKYIDHSFYFRSQCVTNKGHICLPVGLDEQSGQKKARVTLAGGCVLVNRYLYMPSESCVIFYWSNFKRGYIEKIIAIIKWSHKSFLSIVFVSNPYGKSIASAFWLATHQ